MNPEKETVLILTAWKNKYKVKFENFYRAGYSSHSNAEEIEAFVKSVCPKRISFHSNSDEANAVRFQVKLTQEYTTEKRQVTLQTNLSSTQDCFYEAAKLINSRFDKVVAKQINKETFLDQNPFLKKRRKKHAKGSKLQV